jgi:23S rRNA pseudouridine1911/1915/1917 synthase
LLAKLKRKEGGILQNGVPVTVRALLHAGDRITLALEDVEGETSVVPRDLPVSILKKTADFTVVNKSADMPTHPSHGHFEDTLANALAFHLSVPEAPFRPRFINRLDRNTSGVVLIARHALAAQRLAGAMASGSMQKTYLAIVCGVPSPDTGEVITGIRRQSQSIITREVCDLHASGAAYAHTRYRVCAVWQPDADTLPPHLSLVQALPLTGRTHQLRLHFAHIGSPILGDDMYGRGPLPGMIERQALHAASLTFSHPMSGERMTVQAPLPHDMRLLLPLNIASIYTDG